MSILPSTHKPGPKQRAAYGSASNRRSLRKADTMRRLLNAGCTLFTEGGYEATTIDQIASAAGVSRAAFYLHFESKSDIIHALANDVAESLRKRYDVLIELGPDPSMPAVTRWVADFVETCRVDGAMALMLQRTMVRPDVDLVDEIAYYDDLMLRLGTRYPRFGVASEDPSVRAEAQVFFFQLLALIRQVYAADKRLDWSELHKATAKNFLAFIRG